MLVVRPAGPDDYDALAELAVLSGRGFTSLPEDEPTLRDRLEVSGQSFSGAIAPLEAWYTLMIEDCATGRVEGVAGREGGGGAEAALLLLPRGEADPVLLRHPHPLRPHSAGAGERVLRLERGGLPVPAP